MSLVNLICKSAQSAEQMPTRNLSKHIWRVDHRGRVVRQSRAAGFSHVVSYGPKSALGAAAVTSLLDAASHGPEGRWVLLLPAR